jgi:HAMP domain-containing protein
MPPTAMDTTNTWLAVMAVVLIVQTLLMLGIAVVGGRAIAKAMDTVKELEARHLTPLGGRVNEVADRVNAVADDVQEVMARVRRADDAVRAQLGRFDTAANIAGHAISAKVWPVLGLSRAVGAAVKAFTSRGTTRPSSPDTAPVAGVTTR